MNHLTAEKRRTAERVRKLEAEREKLLKHVKDTTLTVQNMTDAVDIPGNVWWKAKMFDAELKNAATFPDQRWSSSLWIKEIRWMHL